MPAPTRRVRHLIAAAVTAAAFALGPAVPAFADPGSGGISDLGVGIGGSFGTVGADQTWPLIDSVYSLADVDVMSGALGSGDITATMQTAYITGADVATSPLMALDTAALAEQARRSAEARRQALMSSDSTKLRSGSVPDPYGPMVEDAIARYCPQLPAGILAAQLAQESNWNPTARSPVGAAGIAQFMPGTWAGHGVDGDGDGRKDVLNPADAIPAAAKYDCTLLAEVKDIPGDATANMLAAYNAGGGNVRKYRGVPPFNETQNYVRTIMARAADYAASEGALASVAGCPTSAPANTLRDGSSRLGVGRLCENSVAKAATPQAAGAVKWALTHLGMPYSQPQRNASGYADCSSWVSRAYQSAGVGIAPRGVNAPTTYTIAAARWGRKIALGAARPGDMVLPHDGHVGMVLSDGWMAHTNRTGDVSHVQKLYGSAWMTVRVDPGRV